MKLESGVEVIINECSLRQAFRLKACIEKEILARGIKVEEVDFENLGEVIRLIMALDSSEELFDLMFECLKKSSYKGIGIKEETFSSPETWGDLYEVFYYCLKVNLYPFYKNLLSKFKILGQEKATENLEQPLLTV